MPRRRIANVPAWVHARRLSLPWSPSPGEEKETHD